jgi:hypothetical protein
VVVRNTLMRRFIAPVAGTLFAIAVARTVGAADWKVLDTNAKRTVMIDVGGIRRDGDVILVWVKFDFLDDQIDPDFGSYRSMLELFAFQCAKGRYSVMQRAGYKGVNGEGDVAGLSSTDRYSWTYPTPESLAEAALNTGCHYVRARKQKSAMP